jgi:L-erythrulose 1-kinase
MTKIFNDAAEFAAESLTEFAVLNADRVSLVHGGLVRAVRPPEGQVALVMGGGSGHFPAFAGWIGTGFGHGAACGRVFASPSEKEVLSVARAAAAGGGVLFLPINYAGDILHFGAAAEALAAEGVDARMVAVTDDIASGGADARDQRRGIAGALLVIKMAGAAAERGMSLDEVQRVAVAANDATRTFGVAFSGCTLPGSPGPLFEVPAGRMAVGLGIHGEPGVAEAPLGSATDVAYVLVDGLFAERAPERGRAVALLVNGLGATKYDELHILSGIVRARLDAEGMRVVAPLAGEYMTSLDMAGASVSLAYLDDELESLWLDPVDSPVLTRSVSLSRLADIAASGDRVADGPVEAATPDDVPPGSPESARAAGFVTAALERAAARVVAAEAHLGAIDAVAGDGDHGAGMVAGIRGAHDAARWAVQRGAGAGTTLRLAGERWSESAGGASGALWGSGLEAAGEAVGDVDPVSGATILAAVRAFARSITGRGGAAVGDKTMVDALAPFTTELEAGLSSGLSPADAWRAAAAAAQAAADATADFAASRGRSRTHGNRSIGTPDPGAISFALIAGSILT